jgi:hypothetical protein
LAGKFTNIQFDQFEESDLAGNLATFASHQITK